MIEASVLLIAALFTPFVTAAAINLFGNYKNLRELAGITGGIILCALLWELSQRVLVGEAINTSLFHIVPNIAIGFSAEPLGLIYAGIAGLLWIITTVYAAGYLRLLHDKKQTRFFIWLSVSIGAALAIAFSANLITMFIFYEILTLATYPLVTHKGDYKAVEAGRKYLAYLVGTSVAFFLPAIITVYHYSGSVSFTEGGVFNTAIPVPAQIILLLAFLYGIGKSAVMPLHKWLPSAMAAPTPVSALLHAVAVVKAGIFCFAKVIIYIFGTESLNLDVTQYVSYIAAFTIITASVIAIFQDSLKLRLAYSTIAQLSYVILAVSLLNPAAVNAASLQIVAHAFAKITLFFTVGLLINSLGVSKVSEMNGAGRHLPLVMLCFFACTLSLMGVPFFAGSEVKDMFVTAAESAHSEWVIYVLYCSALLNAAYFLPITFRAFYYRPAAEQRHKAPPAMVAAIMVTAGLTLCFSLYDHIILELAERL